MDINAWRRSTILSWPSGPYDYGAWGFPGMASDCSGGVSAAFMLLELGRGRRETTATLAEWLGPLLSGFPSASQVGAVGFWNGGKHVMLWTGDGWWGYHGSSGAPSSVEPASYWSDKYDGWRVPPSDAVWRGALSTAEGRAQTLQKLPVLKQWVKP